MRNNDILKKELPKRKSARLKDYDYSGNGYYFVTICAQNKAKIFGEIVGEGFPLPQLSKYGKIVEKCIFSINEKYPNIVPEKFVIMPNHIHIIFGIKNNGRGDPAPTIANVVGWLKYSATKQINLLHDNIGNKIFQRSFHDHVIRGERDYMEICEYINNNPAKWKEDSLY